MKLIRIFFIYLLVSVNALSAQDFHGGLRLGMCASQVSGDNLSGFDKAGILGGAFVKRDFSAKSALRMEMLFIQKGSRSPVSTYDNSYYRMRLHYVEVPVLYEYRVKKKFSIAAGASFGVLVFSEENDQLGVLNNMPEFNKTEFSYHLGMLFNFTEHWTLDLRYSASLTPVRDYELSYYPNYFEKGQFNSSLQLSMYYTF
ncbi:MAG: PorT family protein [Bacteroidia bacterium]|nr:PorT family protein [Bacteroidia bacterium]